MMLFLLTSLALLCVLQASATAEFQLDATRRTTTSNLVQLNCITDLLRGRASPDAVFFLNGTALEDQGIRSARSMDGVQIRITRDTEGTYSCALPFDRRRSTTVTLVGKSLQEFLSCIGMYSHSSNVTGQALST